MFIINNSQCQDDPELEIKEEPEAWSVTVDKKVGTNFLSFHPFHPSSVLLLANVDFYVQCLLQSKIRNQETIFLLLVHCLCNSFLRDKVAFTLVPAPASQLNS